MTRVTRTPLRPRTSLWLALSIVIGITLIPASIYFQYVSRIIPEPYLDEFFHIPQAQKYCAGQFHEWDNKITTPFGLYGLAYLFSRVQALFRPYADPEILCSPDSLRLLNLGGYLLLLPNVVYRIYQTLHPRAEAWRTAEITLIVCAFPLLFFFSTLFYTDIWSTIFVLYAYYFTIRGSNWVAAIFSGASLLFRQTNVLWTAFFTVESAVRYIDGKAEENPTVQDRTRRGEAWKMVLKNSQEHGFLYNPEIGKISLQAFPKPFVSLILTILRNPVGVAFNILPYILVMLSFVSFVIYNGSIVCGDKDAHPFTLHLPQLFYFLTFVLFSSWPLFVSFHLPISFLQSTFPFPFSDRLHVLAAIRRSLISLGLIGAMLAVVHTNTYFHPYLLADNRNYRFYLFRRTLIRYDWAKYLAVGIYFPAAWLLYTSLHHRGVIWVTAYTAAVVGGLIGAGLVEFRYFLLGWVIWRLNISPEVDKNRFKRWTELVWFAGLNVVTVYIFLNWTFKWDGHEGLMRFMW